MFMDRPHLYKHSSTHTFTSKYPITQPWRHHDVISSTSQLVELDEEKSAQLMGIRFNQMTESGVDVSAYISFVVVAVALEKWNKADVWSFTIDVDFNFWLVFDNIGRGPIIATCLIVNCFFFFWCCSVAVFLEGTHFSCSAV